MPTCDRLKVNETDTVMTTAHPEWFGSAFPPSYNSPCRDVACVVKFFSIKMKHVPEASDIPSFVDAVGSGAGAVEHQLDVLAQASGFSEKESQDLEEFVAAEGWGGDEGAEGNDGSADEKHDGEGVDDRPSQEGEEPLDGEARENDAHGVDGKAVEEESSSDREVEEEGVKGRTRLVKAPESMTKRAHAAVQRQRKAAGGGGFGGSTSRNKQKRKEKGKILYKNRDF